MNGLVQAALPLITEEAARAEFRRLADLNAMPPPRKAPYVPHVKGSRTSKAAADSVRPAVPSLEQRVLAWLEARGAEGAADHELLAAFRLTDPQTEGSTVRARRIGWTKGAAPRVVDSGRTRPTPKGRAAVVWRVSSCAETPTPPAPAPAPVSPESPPSPTPATEGAATQPRRALAG